MSDKQSDHIVYWRRNLRYLAVLLSIWFAVSYGCGILLVDELDQIQLGGFKLGFWFAQQGAIYVFVILIFVYVWLMNRLDRTVLESSAASQEITPEPSADAAEEPAGATDVAGDVSEG